MRTLVTTLLLVSAASSPVLAESREQAMRELTSPDGPSRFAEVTDELYRGGAPSAHQLELLRDLGVEIIIDLRQGHDRTEQLETEKLGMHYSRYPFYTAFGAKPLFLYELLEAMHGGSIVYVHCDLGRDRTSLAVALSRVIYDRWSPSVAWRREAVAYGYRPGLLHRAIEHSFYATLRDLEKPIR